ncbi:FAD-dependent oxidoreductase [Bacillaceae bacterium JMAK1]|nr:FAD-dependent oxidoreductase [Bacillaceae bacterium JMAK1]
MNTNHADLLIVGGGVIGSSIAYHLLNAGYEGKVIVFEKDRKYEYSSTPRSAGGIRQLFTTKVNIELSQYSLHVYKNFHQTMKFDGFDPEIDLKQRGYLFLGTDEMMGKFEEHLELQHRLGVNSEILDKAGLLNRIPELNVDDIAGGIYCSESGYLDPYSVMQGYIKNAKRLGVEYVYDEVAELVLDDVFQNGVKMTNGDTYYAPIVINSAGAWASQLSQQAGFPLPVVSLPRRVFQFDTEVPLQNPLPLTMDPTGVYFRHEGKHFISGYAEDYVPSMDFSWKRQDFIENIWPIIGHRVGPFEQLKLQSGWTGLYDHNTEDHNAIIGEHPEAKGYYVAFGFSGHGMQQAPAVGRGLTELIMKGYYDTLDLSPLRVERFKEKELVIEDAIY